MKKFLFLLCSLLLSSSLSAYTESNAPLFELNGQKKSVSDLPLATKNLLYESEVKNYDVVSAIIDDYILNEHFEAIAKKKKITVQEATDKELKVSSPSEKEIKKFYNDNKSSIPASYTYDQIKPQIKDLLKKQKTMEKRAELVEKLKKKAGYKLLIAKPIAPVISIDTSGFPENGDKSSKVTLVEFGNYGCTHCKHFNDVVHKVLKKAKFHFVFIPFTLSSSELDANFVKAGFCAGKQGKYWQYHDEAFANQRMLSEDSLKTFAKNVKMDTAAFEACLKSEEASIYLKHAKDVGKASDVSATPTVFINGSRYLSAISEDALIKAINEAK